MAGPQDIIATGKVSRSSMSETGKLAGKRALVTGAGTGIGLEIALEFGRQGADVVLHYSHAPEAAASAAREIQSMGRRAARSRPISPMRTRRLTWEMRLWIFWAASIAWSTMPASRSIAHSSRFNHRSWTRSSTSISAHRFC